MDFSFFNEDAIVQISHRVIYGNLLVEANEYLFCTTNYYLL